MNARPEILAAPGETNGRTITVREADLNALLDRIDVLERQLASRIADRAPRRGACAQQDLLDQIAELEHALGVTAVVPNTMHDLFGQHCRPCEKLLGVLVTRKRVTDEAAYIALYGDRQEVDQPDPQCIKVYVSHLRRGLRSHGIEIETLGGGLGYRLAPQMRAKAAALIQSAAPPPPREIVMRRVIPFVPRPRERSA